MRNSEAMAANVAVQATDAARTERYVRAAEKAVLDRTSVAQAAEPAAPAAQRVQPTEAARETADAAQRKPREQVESKPGYRISREGSRIVAEVLDRVSGEVVMRIPPKYVDPDISMKRERETA
jgi:hypothetical protein